MDHPIEHMPLAVCDASSIPREDIVLSSLLGFTPDRETDATVKLEVQPQSQVVLLP